MKRSDIYVTYAGLLIVKHSITSTILISKIIGLSGTLLNVEMVNGRVEIPQQDCNFIYGY